MNINPIRFAGTVAGVIGLTYSMLWLPSVTLTISTPLLVKYEPYAQPDAIEAAGQDWERFPGNWATSLIPVTTNEIPWEPFVDPMAVFEWADTASLSNYLATVHSYSFQYSTNCVDWREWLFIASDEGEVPEILRQLMANSLAPGYETNGPAMLLWRAERVE